MLTIEAVRSVMAALGSLSDLLETILSNPAEWWSLFVGIVVSAVVIYVTDDLIEAVLVTIGVLLIALSIVPVRVTAEWHYWGGVVAVMILLGLYELGPKNPF